MRVSVIITNYNYAKYLGQAIDSALILDWPDKEVIVVDDGSTDESRELIESYGDKVVAVFKVNGGQNDAANAGFAKSTGDVVFFLDSDDTLSAHAAQAVSEAFNSNSAAMTEAYSRNVVAKVQFPLATRNADGTLTGGIYPNFPTPYLPADVRRSCRTTGWYMSAPTSGNSWSRAFLDRVFPLPLQWNDKVPAKFFDGYLSLLAASMGDVVTLNSTLGTYRFNPDNSWTRNFTARHVAEACEEDMARLGRLAAKLKELGVEPISKASPYTDMMKRLVYRKFFPRDYPLHESWTTTLGGSYRSVLADTNINAKTKLLLLGWMSAVWFLPQSLALPVVKVRFVPTYRPKIVIAVLRRVGWIGKLKKA